MMKKTIVTLITVVFVICNLPAQDKILTMEEAVLGYNLRPESKNILWQGNKNIYTYEDEKNLVAEDLKGGKNTLLTITELSDMLGTELKRFPSFSWFNDNTLRINYQSKEYRVDMITKTLKDSIIFPDEADNTTYSKSGKLYAYTVDNNLLYMTEQGNKFVVTDDKDPNIVNGQAVSRNEFGIHSGIFWSPDGKKLAF
ncbi:MAG: DPP IV N-terminal domain-containing protein, partial [Tannerella sp.]|nr:DPP IV N-terminal domain-containing protein [Tannerella sp.]